MIEEAMIIEVEILIEEENSKSEEEGTKSEEEIIKEEETTIEEEIIITKVIIKEEEKILIEVLGEVIDRIKTKTNLLTIEENKVKIRPKITIEELSVQIMKRVKLIIEIMIAQRKMEIEAIKEAIKKIKVHTNKEAKTETLIEVLIEIKETRTKLNIQIKGLDKIMRKEEKEMLRIEMSLKISYLNRFLQERMLNK